MTRDSAHRPDSAPADRGRAERGPLARPVPVAKLSRKRPTPVSVEADAAERAAVAAFLDVPRVDRLDFEGVIEPVGDEGFEVRGRLVAELEQTCVVTLAPVPARHDAEIARLYLPQDRIPDLSEVPVDPEEADKPDPYGTSIDPGALALESLALMLDPYPRAPGAKLGAATATPPGAEPIGDEELRPFAGLAELKRRLEGGRK